MVVLSLLNLVRYDKLFCQCQLTISNYQTNIAAFQLQPEDTAQIAGYVEGLQQEYPEAQISQYVIYCFGNQGFRVFQVSG